MTETTTSPGNEEAPDAVAATEPSDEAPDDNAIGNVEQEPNTAGDSTEALQVEIERLHAQHQRAVADYQNLERRSREERQEMGRFATADVIRSFLPVLDDLERAVEAAEGDSGDAAWLDGIRLVVQKFRGLLQQHGVEEIHALGQPFDPNLHEAVGAAAGPDGQVVHLLQRGYMLRDRVVRPAMVMVGNGEDTPGKTSTEE